MSPQEAAALWPQVQAVAAQNPYISERVEKEIGRDQ